MNRAYRVWIRTLPCVAAVALRTTAHCIGRIQFCHLKHEKMGGGAAPDDVGNAFPACAQHHDEYHKLWTRLFSAEYGDVADVCARLGAEFTGDLSFPEEPWASEYRSAA